METIDLFGMQVDVSKYLPPNIIALVNWDGLSRHLAELAMGCPPSQKIETLIQIVYIEPPREGTE